MAFTSTDALNCFGSAIENAKAMGYAACAVKQAVFAAVGGPSVRCPVAGQKVPATSTPSGAVSISAKARGACEWRGAGVPGGRLPAAAQGAARTARSPTLAGLARATRATRETTAAVAGPMVN